LIGSRLRADKPPHLPGRWAAAAALTGGGKAGEGGFDLPGQRQYVVVLVDPQCGVEACLGLVAVTGELVHFGFGH
jgi:hypothetical protein